MEYIIELEPGTQWFAPWSGDPGRTCVIENAKRYKNMKSANAAVSRAKRMYSYRDFSRVKIINVPRSE